tara:strand:- start:3032 stop:4447 length:1416 start_codon:yes stop_codon:yes gene_type:complete
LKTKNLISNASKESRSKNYVLTSLLLSLFVLFFLGTYSYVFEHSSFLQAHFKQINILPIIKDSLKRSSQDYRYLKLKNTKNTLTDLRRERLVLDSINRVVNYDGGQKGLINFMSALYDVEKHDKGTCRIAYFGDSMIEGDLISMTLRNSYQEKYGGRGVGFVPIVSTTNKFRISVIHDYSKVWQTESLINMSNLDFSLGISGEYFLAETNGDNNTVNYRTPNRKYINTFPSTKLFYGKPSVKGSLNALEFNETMFSLDGASEVNAMTLSDTPLKKADLNFKITNSLPIYGISFASNSGVIVDNFALRGNAGITMTSIQQNILNAFNDELDYDLIILQYGLNVANENTKFNWYRARMRKVVEHFKQVFPKASVLLVSVPDMSKKNKEGEMQTLVSIPYIVEAQKKAAMQSGVSFFNLYNAMGGENSMVKWVEDLNFANKDYTHFNYKGARNASNLIFSSLEKEYLKFKENDE